MKKLKRLKKWQIILLVVVVVGVFAAMSGGSDDKDTTSDKKESTKEEVKTYTVGEVVPVGDVEYTVNSISSTKTIGSDYLNNDAQEMYLVVNISIKNNGDEALNVSDSFFKLLKGKKTYETDSGSAIYLEDSIIYKDINPEATLTGSFVFDVTQETIDDQSLQLQVQTGVWGTETEVINLH